jgi:hypothetical protein
VTKQSQRSWRQVRAESVAAEFPAAEATAWPDLGYTTVVGLMSRSTRDPRFRRWPQTGYPTRLVDPAQLLVEREAVAARSARSRGHAMEVDE